MTANSQRPYLDAWEAVKLAMNLKVPYATFQLSSDKHKTFLQGLRRESMRDSAFRFACAEQGKSFVIGFNSIGDILQVYLRWKNNVTPSFVKRKRL